MTSIHPSAARINRSDFFSSKKCRLAKQLGG
jgi:hypothetical protein